jgi:hypothetical protein
MNSMLSQVTFVPRKTRLVIMEAFLLKYMYYMIEIIYERNTSLHNNSFYSMSMNLSGNKLEQLSIQSTCPFRC